jgi:Ca2+-binding EF-hand superfamily protein
MSRVRWILIGVLGCALSAGGAQPADRVPSAAPVPAAKVTALPDGDVRDVLLLLDDGPLHLRFRVTLSGVSLAAAREAYVDRLLRKLDTNGDGKLSPEELAHSPLAPPRRASGNAFLQSLDANRGKGPKDGRTALMQQVEKEGGETVSYRQDTSASNNDKEVFKLLDTDKSGYLDRSEMAAAAAKILERDQDQDECITFQEFLPEPEPDPAALLVTRRPGAPERPTATRGDLLRDISEPTLAVRLIKQYDKNRDGKLSPDELTWSAERVKMLDANADGKLNEKELKGIAQTPVDLELAVDLNGAPDGQPAIAILSNAGDRVDDGKRPDLVRLAFARAVVTLSFRKVDSLKASIESAMRTFNQLDADGNGYLDRKETAGPAGTVNRFETEKLFDALDADGDGKIFGEEMEKYVTVRAEPFASTAKVNLYDTGRGFFEALDTNGDGRISMREMKAAARSLQNLARRNTDKLSPEDPARNFHIEFTRGSFTLFKQQADLAAAPTTSFEQREPIGPTWFQRMDRNSDGDLTWNEFLGPREVFNRIDKDGDGLIDPQEAFEASEE